MSNITWNGERAWGRNRKIALNPEQIEELGAKGQTIAALAKELKVGTATLSQIINKNLTNREAFDRGRLKANGK